MIIDATPLIILVNDNIHSKIPFQFFWFTVNFGQVKMIKRSEVIISILTKPLPMKNLMT